MYLSIHFFTKYYESFYLDILLAGKDSNDNLITKIYRNSVNRDDLYGTDGNETLHGGASNDTLNGSLGADALNGGNGEDRAIYHDSDTGVTVDLDAGTGTGGYAEGDSYDSIEYVDGSRFSDTLTGNDSNNRFYGGKGGDYLSDSLGGDDYLSGQEGDDSLEGGDGADRLLGGDGDDTLLGEAGNDILAGGNGDDNLTGASTATNGLGEIDRLSGDAGVDTFVLGNATNAFYDDGDNANNGIADYALIHDFDDTQDFIELSNAG